MKNMTKSCIFLITLGLCPLSSAAQTDTLSIDEVVVTGTRHITDVRHLPMTISLVRRDRLTSDYRQSVLPTVNEQVPGLFVTSRGVAGYGVSSGAAGTIKVRGVGSGADMLVLIDGQPQYAGLYGHPIADAFQTMMTEKVEVLRGPASLMYGSNAMGGVMNIVTRQMNADGMRTDVQLEGGSYGTVQGEITNRLRRGRFSSIAGLSYLRTDGHRPNSEFEQYTGFAKLGYDLSGNWRTTGDVNLTYFESSNPGMTSNPLIDNDMKITRGMASVALINDYGHTSGALRAYFNWGHHNINDGHNAASAPRSSLYMHDDRLAGLSLYQSIRLFEGNLTTLGVDYQHFGGEAWNRPIDGGDHSVIADRSLNEIAAYIDFRQDITSWLTLDAGIRTDHLAHKPAEFIPQGGLSFRLSSDAAIKAMVSRGFRNPTIREMYMFNPKNADLKPQSMMNYELSYTQHLMDGRMHLGASVFYLKAKDMISVVRTDGRPLNMNIGRTENSGVELEARYTVDRHWRVNTNYSYLHTSAHISGAPRHKWYGGADYSCGRLGLSTGLMYFAGLYTSETTGEKAHAALWHLTASMRIASGLHIYVRGDNLLAQKYEINDGFPMPRATVTGGLKWTF